MAFLPDICRYFINFEMINAIIFDMDGLLVDTEPLWQEAELKCFREAGMDLTHQMLKETTGLRINEVVEFRLIQFKKNGIDAIALQNKIMDDLIILLKERSVEMKGMRGALETAKKSGKKTALASSSNLVLIDFIVDKFGIRQFFDVIHSAEFESKGKPDPAVFLTTAKLLGVPPENCLVLEDSVNGFKAAKAAGMKTIAIPEPGDKNHPAFAEADFLLESLEDFNDEMLEKIENNFN
jgi:mannitol-1-/sugar-/sorbitol-6-/2-deoxyglucose-6-phosphatase